MTEADVDNFTMLLTRVHNYYEKELTPEKSVIWWGGLQHYDFDAIKLAFNRHLQNPDEGMFMPKIANINKMLEGSTSDSALRAWTKVDKAVRQVGPYASIAFDDPIIHRVIDDMGGWLKLCGQKEAEWQFFERTFVHRYREYKGRSEIPEHPLKLIGMAEAHNSQNNMQIPEPRLLGDKTRAMEVLEGKVKRLK